ncbi:MAG: hypothetical protein RMJ84_12100, partial [Sandaracinaceae bacterium]|nr:hypothetical protein [Sandaracinaceae bacterium]
MGLRDWTGRAFQGLVLIGAGLGFWGCTCATGSPRDAGVLLTDAPGGQDTSPSDARRPEDAGRDARQEDAVVLMDAGVDAFVPIDAGQDAGQDAFVPPTPDAGQDAGRDAFMPIDTGQDAGRDAFMPVDAFIPAPPNDTCAGAIALSGRSGTRTDTFDGARRDVSGCGLDSGADVFYSITVSEPSLL